MNISSQSQLMNVFGGVVAVLATAGLGAYFLLVLTATQPTVVTPVSHPTQVLEKEFSATGIFTKARSISQSPATSSETTQPTVGEIGKSDLSVFE